LKAITYTEYGPPEALKLAEVEKPVPKDNQVLVKVHAASVNALEWRRFESTSPLFRLIDGGLLKPKNTAMGADVAGRVEAVGKAVTQFKPGDAVFGVTRGSFAEYVCAAERSLALKPERVSFEAAAATPVAGLTALLALRDVAKLQPGQTVLVNGASGGVGIFSVQIAKAFGAEVTAVCSTRNLDMVRALGADHVVDYTREDFTKSGRQYDLILAVNGYHPILDYRRALRPEGMYVSAGGSLSQIFEGMLLGRLLSRRGGKTLTFMGITTTNQKDLAALGELLDSGKVVPVIDRHYPLGEVPKAMRYLVDEHARGKVIISLVP
jgi:NADPH:quinone reductase-like Zn-dependent oxidoreductase